MARYGIIYHGTQGPESFRSVFELDEAHNQHIRFIISLCDTFRYSWGTYFYFFERGRASFFFFFWTARAAH